MLTTLYELRYQRWIPIKEYYQFTQAQYRGGAQTDTHRVVCPGCARRLSMADTMSHTCLGGQDPWPRLSRKFEPNRRWNPRKGTPLITDHPQAVTYTLNSRLALTEYLRQNPQATVDE